jgi:CheY-like chemotaxis protein
MHMPRVFHCDDEPNYRSLVRVVLTNAADADYELVGEASDGREAIDRAPALEPDIVLLDVNMPGMGGIEALPELRKALPRAKIIALTTSWRSAWEENWRSLGGDAFIEKPRDALSLPGLIDAAITFADSDPLDVAEEMFHSWWADDRPRSWAMFDEDAVFHTLEDGTIYGVEDMQRYVESRPEGTARAIRMLGFYDTVVIEAAAEVGEGEARERFPIAWVLRVRDGHIREIRAFRSWSAAHDAAGITASIEPTSVRELGLGAGWIFAQARRLLGRSAPATAPAA